MEIIITENPTELGEAAGNYIITLLSRYSSPLICPASGDSPRSTYQYLASKHSSRLLDTSDWQFVGLDEWAGMNAADEGSCRYHIQQDFFTPLGVADERIVFFDGRAADPHAECKRVEDYLTAMGGITLAILGLGTNAHIAMNEPGTSPDSRVHVSDIAPETAATGQKYFTTPRTLTQGLTMGIANLMEARHVLLLVAGEKKAQVLRNALEGPITTDIPASLLRNHPDFTVLADNAAAKLLSTIAHQL